jgi:hypothetical protein
MADELRGLKMECERSLGEAEKQIGEYSARCDEIGAELRAVALPPRTRMRGRAHLAHVLWASSMGVECGARAAWKGCACMPCVAVQQRRRCCIFLCCFNVRSASAQPLLDREASTKRKKSLRGLHAELVDDNMPEDDDDTCAPRDMRCSIARAGRACRIRSGVGLAQARG